MHTSDDTRTTSDRISKDETFDLISSEKVDGTAVYNRDDEKLGSIQNLMLGKRDGCVRYAVLSYGGLFSMGDNLYPLPWEALTYSEDKGGYVVNLSKDQLDRNKAPSYPRGQEPSWNEDYDTRVRSYYLNEA
jgi:hypothetical protein